MMRLMGSLAVARRELAFLRGSVAEQLLWVWSPLLAVGLILWLFSGGVPAGLPISVVDQDQSASSRELIRRLSASRALLVRAQAVSMKEAWPQIRSANVYAMLHIPAGWEVERLRGSQKPVVLYNNLQAYLVAGLVSSAVREAVASRPSCAKPGLAAGWMPHGCARRLSGLTCGRSSIHRYRMSCIWVAC
jgi:ABC-2 type transport system permease protein